MNEQNFVTQKREGWDRLAALVEKANGPKGVRALDREEVRTLGPLYRRVSSDLAYARANATSGDLVLHLNGLVGRAHALLYEAEKSASPGQSVLNFYLNEFPALLQRRVGYFLAAFGVTVIGGLFAYWLVITHPARLDVFIPAELRSSVDVWKSGKIAADPSPAMSGQLMQHNFTVGMVAFASGVLLVFPALAALFNNGATLGALAALMTQVHHHDTLWPGILPHGIAELTAIFICGGAGIQIGMSVLLPGAYVRADALRLAGRDGIRLVLGTIPLFIFAGLIEGMFSHLPLPGSIRLSFAALNGVMWYLYLFLPRRAK
jgi:uncharacterized membrane protein SpoIIM required for sporulation